MENLVVRALVDSGATRTFAGEAGARLFEKAGIPLDSIPPVQVITAGGQAEIVTSAAIAPVSVSGKTTKVTALILPSLCEDFILGMDFLMQAKLVIDFADRTWYYKGQPHRVSPFVPVDTVAPLITLCGLKPLDSSQEATLAQFLKDHLPPDPDPDLPFPATSLVEHFIDVGDATPIRQAPYRTSPAIYERMSAQTDKMLKSGIIEVSYSAWSSPVVMVPKGDDYRFCVDYRKLNAVTRRDAYPLPNMSGILDGLKHAHHLTTLDLRSAYHQIPLAPQSREVTAFTVPGRGLFQFRRLCFGLTNAPAMFQRFIDRLLGHKFFPNVFVYLDDIIIVTETFERHLELLKQVLDILTDAGLVINREKSHFCRDRVQYLGFLVDSRGLHIDPSKTNAVLDFPVPKDLKALRRFLGMSGWYRRFIPEYATITEPLTRLLKATQPWTWTEEQQRACDQVKLALTSPPILASPDFSVPFTLQTDASTVGVGAALSQTLEGEERVIAYASRTLNKAERKYSTTEQECLAVKWAVQQFRCYLEGYRFTVITDHSSLRWLNNVKDTTGRLSRWALQLMGYDFTIVHRKGKEHLVPDALSRAPVDNPSPERISAMIDTQDAWYRKQFLAVQLQPEDHVAWKIEDDNLYFHRPLALASLEFPDLNSWKLVLPKELRSPAIRSCHAPPHAGHLGIDKTYRRVTL